MKRLQSAFRLFGMYCRYNLASLMEYRQSFLMSAFGMLRNNCTFVFFWKIAFAQIGGRIGGYDFQDVMFIWAAASTAFGLSHILMGNLSNLGGMIMTGDLDVYLLQPRSPLLSILCSRMELSAWGDLLYGIILMCIVNNTPTMWLCWLLSATLGSVLFVATGVLFNSLTFFFGDSSLASGMAMEFVINFCLYPESIYHKAVQMLMYTAIPAGFIVHVPLRLARAGNPLWLVLLVAYTVFYAFFAVFAFEKGLKRYESGNLIGTRM